MMIAREIEVNAEKQYVWWAWTQSDRIVKWFAPAANVYEEAGQPYELFFDPSKRESMSTAGCKVLESEPMRLLRFTWKGPDPFADVMNGSEALTVVSVTFEETKPGTTAVNVQHTGWGSSEAWDAAKKWHEAAWDQVLSSLKKALESGEGELCCAPGA